MPRPSKPMPTQSASPRRDRVAEKPSDPEDGSAGDDRPRGLPDEFLPLLIARGRQQGSGDPARLLPFRGRRGSRWNRRNRLVDGDARHTGFGGRSKGVDRRNTTGGKQVRSGRMKNRRALRPAGARHGFRVPRGSALDHRADRFESLSHLPCCLGGNAVLDDFGQALFEGTCASRIDAERALEPFRRCGSPHARSE